MANGQAEPEAARLLFPSTSVGVAVGRTVGVVGRTVAGKAASKMICLLFIF